MKNEERALFNLVEFDRSFLRPVTSHFNETHSNVWKTERFCELIGAYLWLELGIEVGYFPIRESASAVGQRLIPFFASFRQLFTDYGYMFDESVKVVFNQALRAPFVHPSRPDIIEPSIGSLAAFSSALNSEMGLAGSRFGEALSALLNFAPDQLQKVIQFNHAIEDEVARVFDNSAVERGFATVVEYMESLVGLSSLIVSDRDIAELQRPGLERRIRQITRWRVNRFRSGCDGEFLEVGRFATRDAEVGFHEIEPKLVTLLDTWGFTHTKFITAG